MHQPDAPPLDTATATSEDEARLLATFRSVSARMPWYRALLAERGISPEQVRSATDFARLCPRLTKQNTFERFGVRALAATTPVTALASVLTSSGHGGRFSFGLATREMDAAGAEAIDAALDAAFDVRSRPTLALNCLPMGVTFGSRCMTVATTSVREDMVAALVQSFAPEFAQILLVADPLFLKRLTDHARDVGLDWRRHRVQVVVGEEVFGERFRSYMANRLGLDLDDERGTWLMSSMGVGELGLHLFYETRALVSLRRLAAATPALAEDLVGPAGDAHGTPLCFTYDARRIHVEVDAPGRDGFGRLLVSMLDPELPIPLLRYETGDVARVLDAGDVRALLRRHGAPLAGDLPDRVVQLRGRTRETLPDGSHVAIYKDAIYADAATADALTGAVRLTFDGPDMTMHVQLVPGAQGHAGIADALRQALPAGARPASIEVWPYGRFPFGMTLDYERKFVSYVP
jgi:phenylacetate-CoA ligase